MVTVSWRVKSWILQQHQLLSWILYLKVSKVRRVGGTDLYVDKPLRIEELEIMARIRVKNRKTDTDDSGSHGSGVREKRLGREDQKLSVLSSLSLPHEFPPSFLHEMGEQTSSFQCTRVAYSDHSSNPVCGFESPKPVLLSPNSTESNLFHHGETTYRVGRMI